MTLIYICLGIVLILIIAILIEICKSQASANARAISLHVISTIIPMIEKRGYKVKYKKVSFGKYPYISFDMESINGLSIYVQINQWHGYFKIYNAEDSLADFSVSGPWDELTYPAISYWEKEYVCWSIRRSECNGPEPVVARYSCFYLPVLGKYINEGGEDWSSPTDPKHKRVKWMHNAHPRDRYPLASPF